MAGIYREFVLSHKNVWASIVGFVKANYRACVDNDQPLHIIITTAEKKRNSEQNKRLWGYLYKTIAEQAWVDGKQYPVDAWHEYFAIKHCPKIEVVVPRGEIISRRKSTSEMNVGEFSEFMQQIEAEAATEFGVVFE